MFSRQNAQILAFCVLKYSIQMVKYLFQLLTGESGKSLLVWVKYTGAWGKITPMKILPNISAYVSLKDFTPDLIFLHSHICEFCNSVRCKSLLVWFKCTGARGKITQMKVLPNISTYVTLPIFYPRPPKLLHRYICRFCDILLLCKVG